MSWLDQLLSSGSTSGKRRLVDEQEALPGRGSAVPLAPENVVLHHPMRGTVDANHPDVGDFGDGLSAVILAGGCFWGVEEIFWQLPGVYTTAVGYAGGYTPNPAYEEVCTARTGHTEAVLVVFDPSVVDLEGILKVFWETHDPTQEMQQGNDIGTQYRSAIYTFSEEDAAVARKTAEVFGKVLADAGLGAVATEIKPLSEAGDGHFYYAEGYHQQYLAKNPAGYRCHAATGLHYPVG